MDWTAINCGATGRLLPELAIKQQEISLHARRIVPTVCNGQKLLFTT